jgi:hypothetical protein
MSAAGELRRERFTHFHPLFSTCRHYTGGENAGSMGFQVCEQRVIEAVAYTQKAFD